MKKKTLFKILLMISILYVPISVNASCIVEPIEVNVCLNGCQFNNIEAAVEYIHDNRDSCTNGGIINIGPGEYTIDMIEMHNYHVLAIKGSGIDKTIINFLGPAGIYATNIYSIELSDFTIKNRKNSNSEVAIGIRGVQGKSTIKNIKIDSHSQYGIFTGSVLEGETINNVDIKGAKESAIYRCECGLNKLNPTAIVQDFNPDSAHYNGVLEVINCDLTGNGCGVVEGSDYCSSESPMNNSSMTPAEKFEDVQGIVPEKNYKYTTGLRNTKLSCAVASSDRESNYTPLIYIPKNNTWVEEPEYLENVVEYNDGQVQVELEDDRTLGLNNKSGISLTDVFKNIDSFGDKEIEIEDESIIKIEGDKIVPLQVGETTTKIKSGNTTYTINLRVVESINNPKTSNTTYILILVLSLVIISTFMRVMKPKKIKR